MNDERSDQRWTPFFQKVFWTIVTLSVLSLLLAIALSMRPNQTLQEQQMLETCSTCWKLGFGAIVGLIGGKAT